MEAIHQCSRTGLRVQLICGLGSDREAAEHHLLAAGVSLPLTDRAVWTTNDRVGQPRFLLVRDAAGNACGGAAIQESKIRALPGHVVLRVRRFGNSLPLDVCCVLAEALAIVARKTTHVLRLQVNVFSRNDREAIDAIFQELGFAKVQPPSSYQHTLVVDLRPSEDEIFASFSKKARQCIRDTWKKELKSRVLTDPKYAERISQLQQEALRRTGGDFHADDWDEHLRLSRENPHLSAIFGLFLDDGPSPDDMLAFGWVLNHGDHSEYHAAGSTRRNDVKVSLGYVPVWEMIRWSKACGAQWFDMGGVTLEGAMDIALEGISSFKRTFTRDAIEVGSEWTLEPSPSKAKIASLVSDGADQLRALLKKRH